MLVKILINYIFGFLHIELEGYFIERVINTCISKNIFLWKIKRNRSTILNANIGAGDFKSIVKIAKKHGCKIKIKSKHGMPFFIRKYRKRKIFVILPLIVIVSIFILSKFVWNVEVIGTTKIDKGEIIKELEEGGLKAGILKSKVESESIINKIRLERADIAWMGITIDGTNAVVKIVEAEEKPEIIDENDYCNIVAKKGGIINKISAQNGSIMVKQGEEVKEGDVLIAGWMEGKYTGKNYVNATGSVKAKVLYTQTEKIDKKVTKKEETGNSENKYAIKFNNFKINFYKTLSKYENYDTMYTSKKLKLFSNFYLPIEIIKYTNNEVTETEITYGSKDAKELGLKKAKEALEDKISGEVINKKVELKEQNSCFEVKVTYEVIEEIGTKEKIVF